MTRPERYILKTGEAGASRLRLLHTFAGPATEAWLRQAGLRRGMRVADIACGIGTVTAFLAGEVGPDGSVVGVDASEEQIAVARRDVQSAGLRNVRWIVASAYETGLPHADFDLVFCRLLLCHLQRPHDALQEMHALLKPGGILVCEDRDTGAIFAEPPQEVYAQEVERVRKVMLKRGLDPDIARKLPRMFMEFGLTDVQLNTHQRVHLRGDAKRIWEYSVAEAVPGLVEEGVMTQDEAQHLLAEIARVNLDETIVVGSPRMWQVSGHKP